MAGAPRSDSNGMAQSERRHNSTGSEDITRADTALTFRIHNLHGITLRYSTSSRNGRYATLPTSHQTIGTFSIGYTLLGQTRFGAVDWR